MLRTRTSQPHSPLPRNSIDMLKQQLPPVKLLRIDQLKPYARALRKHPERQIVALAASIQEFGFNVPILVDEDLTIISGAARIEAAKRLGYDTLPGIELAGLSPAQIRAFRIADNKLHDLSSFDAEILALEMVEILSISEVTVETLGFETTEVDLMLTDVAAEKAKPDPADLVPAPPARPVSRPGDLWVLGSHRLLCASSLEAESWIQVMAGSSGSMAFTDAPYNVPVNGHVSGTHRHAEFAMASGEMNEAEFTAFNQTYLSQMSRHLCDGSLIYACMDWTHLFEIQSGARQAKLKLINLCVWNKTNGGLGSLYRSKYELVLVLKKGKAPHTNNVKLGATGRYRTNVWDYAGANSFGRTRDEDLAAHPTVKPIALVADAIRDASRLGEIVVDAFVGSGTTILAAERTKRRAFGIEIAPAYVDVALQRWTAMSRQEAVLEATGETFSEVEQRRRDEAASPPLDPMHPVHNIVVRARQRRAA